MTRMKISPYLHQCRYPKKRSFWQALRWWEYKQIHIFVFLNWKPCKNFMRRLLFILRVQSEPSATRDTLILMYKISSASQFKENLALQIESCNKKDLRSSPQRTETCYRSLLKRFLEPNSVIPPDQLSRNLIDTVQLTALCGLWGQIRLHFNILSELQSTK